jgi:hypothetical protein
VAPYTSYAGFGVSFIVGFLAFVTLFRAFTRQPSSRSSSEDGLLADAPPRTSRLASELADTLSSLLRDSSSAPLVNSSGGSSSSVLADRSGLYPRLPPVARADTCEETKVERVAYATAVPIS